MLIGRPKTGNPSTSGLRMTKPGRKEHGDDRAITIHIETKPEMRLAQFVFGAESVEVDLIGGEYCGSHALAAADWFRVGKRGVLYQIVPGRPEAIHRMEPKPPA